MEDSTSILDDEEDYPVETVLEKRGNMFYLQWKDGTRSWQHRNDVSNDLIDPFEARWEGYHSGVIVLYKKPVGRAPLRLRFIDWPWKNATIWVLAPPPEIGETRRIAYNQLNPGDAWFDFTRCRRGLHSMCLVSRHLSEIARPLLYCVVPLWHEAAIVLFFRTLCSKPEYGLWARELASHITLTAPSVIQNFRLTIAAARAYSRSSFHCSQRHVFQRRPHE